MRASTNLELRVRLSEDGSRVPRSIAEGSFVSFSRRQFVHSAHCIARTLLPYAISSHAIFSRPTEEMQEGKDLYAATEDQSICDSPYRHAPARATLDRTRETPPVRLADVF